MQPQEEIIVGLDVGTTKICAVVGELAGGDINIIGIGTHLSTGLRKGVVVNIESTVESIQKAVEEAELMAGCEISSVYAGIAGGHITGFNSRGIVAIKGPEITDNDVERVIDAARAVAIPMDREVIHVLPQEFIVDDQTGIQNPVGMAGVRLEAKIHIVTGAVTSAHNIVKCCNRSGLDVCDIVLESRASGEAVLTSEERELGTALMVGPWAAAEGQRVSGTRVQDILPTILHALELPVGEDMDGEPALQLLGSAGGRDREIETIPTWETGEGPDLPEAQVSPVAELIEERIRALGYIE